MCKLIRQFVILNVMLVMGGIVPSMASAALRLAVLNIDNRSGDPRYELIGCYDTSQGVALGLIMFNKAG